MTAPDPAGTTGYPARQKVLHWAVVLLLAAQYFVFDAMGRLFHGLMDTGTIPWTVTSVAHVAIGSAVLGLALVRIVLRLRDGVPPPPDAEPERFRRLSKLGHGAIYVLLILIPVSGLAAWFGQAAAAAEAHEVMTTLLQIVVILHVASVLVHQFWWKTGLLSRMT